MFNVVLSPGKNLQVIPAVVLSILISMVDYFALAQGTSQVLLRYYAVLVCVSTRVS